MTSFRSPETFFSSYVGGVCVLDCEVAREQIPKSQGAVEGSCDTGSPDLGGLGGEKPLCSGLLRLGHAEPQEPHFEEKWGARMHSRLRGGRSGWRAQQTAPPRHRCGVTAAPSH